MSLMRIKLIAAVIVCVFALTNSGCLAPWAAPPLQDEGSERRSVAEGSRGLSPQVPQVDAAGEEPDLAGVLDKLQQVRAIDPAAEQKLLDELRRTPANSWPLVAEQFRSSLAYHEQLATKEGNGPTEPRAVARVDRPSAPIGTLVDPHKAAVDGVSSEALAASTPYSTPKLIPQHAIESAKPEQDAPAEFSSSGPAYPIATQYAATEPSVVQARLDTLAGPGAAEQLETPPNGDWQQLVKQAADELSRRVNESPTTTAEVHQHVSLRMLRLLAGETEKALAPIPHIGPTEQDFWSRQLFALATYLDHHSQPDDKRRAAASVTHLDEAVSDLRELGSLSLRNLSFCKNVYGYGAIEPFDSDDFSPGQQVSLYVEVENYHSRSTEKGFCTSLGSTYEILNEQGQRVGGGEFPDVEDCCRSRRRDFHIQYGLALSEKLAPGPYQLQLVVKDRQSDKIGHATAAFEIRGNRP